MSTMTDELHCALCGRIWTGGVDEAVEDGAAPDFWIGDENLNDDPVCAECCAKFLTWETDSGELEARPGTEAEVRERMRVVRSRRRPVLRLRRR